MKLEFSLDSGAGRRKAQSVGNREGKFSPKGDLKPSRPPFKRTGPKQGWIGDGYLDQECLDMLNSGVHINFNLILNTDLGRSGCQEISLFFSQCGCNGQIALSWLHSQFGCFNWLIKKGWLNLASWGMGCHLRSLVVIKACYYQF